MLRPVNINFLTEGENACLELLIQAQDLFDKLCEEDPQNSADAYNFGRYLDSARTAVLVRGARRIDPENLLTKHSTTSGINLTFDKLMRKISDDPNFGLVELTAGGTGRVDT